MRKSITVGGRRAASTRYVSARMDSPVGQLTIIATDAGLAAVLWEGEDLPAVRVDASRQEPAHPVVAETMRQLDEYFAGRRTSFALPLDVTGTPFQLKVWEALRTIPFGETRSYAEIAARIGRPRAVRAVGAANGRNPVSIVTPCHRVIGSTGKLTGFAAGLDTKARLLALEGSRATATEAGGPGSTRNSATNRAGGL
jgi:methylated-DNA-[protein]-cysteine S-methyltransferase